MTIDIILLILLILLTARGFIRGFVKEFFSLGAPVLGILVAFLLYKNGAEFIRSKYMNVPKGVAEVLAFIALFLIIFIVCKFAQKIILDVVEGTNLANADKVLGTVFGLAEGIALVTLVLFVIYKQPLFNSNIVFEGSIFWGILGRLIRETSGEVFPGNSVMLFTPFNRRLG